MEVKRYLAQALQLDSRIDSKLEQVWALRSLATKTSATISGMPRSTPNAQSMEAIVAKIVDLEAEINRDIDALVDLKRDIVAAIRGVSHPEHQALLELRYLCRLNWAQIAERMGYSPRHVHTLHGQALERWRKDSTI